MTFDELKTYLPARIKELSQKREEFIAQANLVAGQIFEAQETLKAIALETPATPGVIHQLNQKSSERTSLS